MCLHVTLSSLLLLYVIIIYFDIGFRSIYGHGQGHSALCLMSLMSPMSKVSSEGVSHKHLAACEQCKCHQPSFTGLLACLRYLCLPPLAQALRIWQFRVSIGPEIVEDPGSLAFPHGQTTLEEQIGFAEGGLLQLFFEPP